MIMYTRVIAKDAAAAAAAATRTFSLLPLQVGTRFSPAILSLTN